jgi:hypothetical protein
VEIAGVIEDCRDSLTVRSSTEERIISLIMGRSLTNLTYRTGKIKIETLESRIMHVILMIYSLSSLQGALPVASPMKLVARSEISNSRAVRIENRSYVILMKGRREPFDPCGFRLF